MAAAENSPFISTAAAPSERSRWHIGVEGRAVILVAAALVSFGLVVLYSASEYVAIEEGHDGSYYLFRQLIGIAIGVVGFAVAAKMDAEKWKDWAWKLMGLTLFLMLLTVLPFTQHIAPRIHGSRRFLFGASVQPSELGKLAVVIWSAMLAVRKGDALRGLTKGVLPFFVIVGAMDVLVTLEPDLSTALLYTLLATVVLFAAGVRIGHFIAIGLLAIPLLWREAEHLQYVVLRAHSFLDPGKAPEKVGYQLKQSLIAVGSGRLLGVGLGKGWQQFGFLPFPFNDFIASNIGEEWGFLGLLLLVSAFALFAWLGLRIARQARTPFQQLTAVGITTAIVMNAFLHIGVVIGLLPTTGLTLPFISYGRSNLILTLLMTGILVNIGSARERVHG